MKKTVAILLAAMLLTMSGCSKPVSEPAESKEAVEQPAQTEGVESKEEAKVGQPNASSAVAKQLMQVQGDGEKAYFAAGGLFEYSPQTGETKTLYMPEDTDPSNYAVFLGVTEDAVYFPTGDEMRRYDRASGKVEQAFELEGVTANLQLLDNQLIVFSYEDGKAEPYAYDLANNYQEIPLAEIQGTWLSMDNTRPDHPIMSKNNAGKSEKIEETYHYGWNGSELYYSSDNAGKQIYQYDLNTGEKTSFAKQDTVIEYVSVDENWVYSGHSLEAQKVECYRFNRKTGEKEELPDEFFRRPTLVQLGDTLYGYGGATESEDQMICMGTDGKVKAVTWEEVPAMDEEDFTEGDDKEEDGDQKGEVAEVESDDTYQYESQFGFTLEFPEDWKEDVEMAEKKDENYVHAYFKPDYDDAQKDNSKPWGKLFFVERVDKEANKDRYDVLSEPNGPFEVMAEKDNTVWFWGTATDSDSDSDNKERFADFLETFQEIDAVKKTFRLTE